MGSVAAAYLAQWTNRRATYFGLALASLGVCAYLFRVPQEFGNQFLALVMLTGVFTVRVAALLVALAAHGIRHHDRK